ncbi:MAG: ornithine carbamoyltransferase [Magnetovibrio sp.]|nr:ornithine carbamoyltransferase [Magnetovibrio sp.]
MEYPRHFLDLDRFNKKTLRKILSMGVYFKNTPLSKLTRKPLANKTVAMLFEKPSTRTRVSFEVGIHQLGGNAIILDDSMTQLGRRETIADVARVLSRYVDGIIIRTDNSEKLEEFQRNSSIPVINGLTNNSHPCQIMADIMTYEEHRGNILDRSVAWIGDGNNVAVSWVHAASKFSFKISIATPPDFGLPTDVISWAKNERCALKITADPVQAISNADLVVTDTWVSMGEKIKKKNLSLLEPYQVNSDLMHKAASDALFMHCLPANRGKEVTTKVLDGTQSVVWDEAENRLHAQKGILAWCIAENQFLE